MDITLPPMLPGPEGGTAHAALQIYHASSPVHVSPVRFYETNTVAMADIERCAEEEAALTGAAK